MTKTIFDTPLNYEDCQFHMMHICARDGFRVSLQLNAYNYCSSERGYREFGYEWETVEFGMTSVHEPFMDMFAEKSGDTTNTVGRIDVDTMQYIFDKYHGGIDWEETLSVKNCLHFQGNYKKIKNGFVKIR